MQRLAGQWLCGAGKGAVIDPTIPDLTHPQKAKHMFADRKTLGGEKMRKSAILATAAALALAGCSKGSTDETSTSQADAATPAAQADVSGANSKAEISQEDRALISLYGNCGISYTVTALTYQRSLKLQTSEHVINGMTDLYEVDRRYAILYTMAAAEIVEKYENQEEGIYIANSFKRETDPEKKTFEYFRNYSNNNCAYNDLPEYIHDKYHDMASEMATTQLNLPPIDRNW